MKYLLSFFFIIGLTIGLKSQDTDFSKKADSLVLAKMQAYQTPGVALGVVKDGKVLHAKGYGVANVATQEPVTERSIFHTASVSKLFTALAIMELVIEEKLSLDDKLTDLLKNLGYKDQKVETITIRQMLDHTSGLPDVWNYHWGRAYTDDETLRFSIEQKRLRTNTTPGEKYKYSNLAYDILGVVVEEVSNKYFEDYIREKWLIPAGMNDSDFIYPKTPESLRTSPHNLKGNKAVVQEIYPYNREHGPSSTLNSSANDLSQWMIHFMKSLQNSANKEVYQSMLETSSSANEKMGLGFHLGDARGHKMILHYGGDKGYRSYLFMIPEKEMGFVLLVNCDYNDDIRNEVLHPLARIFLND